jgi:hypothetical protein
MVVVVDIVERIRLVELLGRSGGDREEETSVWKDI